jgi:hypothetical protein
VEFLNGVEAGLEVLHGEVLDEVLEELVGFTA